jgi:DNA repair protein RadC
MENIDTYSLKKKPSEMKRMIITSASDCYEYVKKFYSDDIDVYESVFLILLDRKGETIGWVKLSQGGLTSSIIDIKILLKYVIDSMASSFILCHNHPSGNMKPSSSDISITNKIRDAAKLLDCSLHDHLIISDSEYISLAEEGLI